MKLDTWRDEHVNVHVVFLSVRVLFASSYLLIAHTSCGSRCPRVCLISSMHEVSVTLRLWVPENEEYHLAHNLKKRCIKRKFTGIHDRFLRDRVFGERMLENNRDEDVCREWDDLAEQDHTYWMSEPEYFHYRQNWWIPLSKSRNTTEPMRKRSDFNHALSTLNRLHREAGGRQLRHTPYWKYQEWKPASSSSSTWWQWSESWWSP